MTTEVLELEVSLETTEITRLYAGIRVSIVRVTPAIAAQWLEKNVRNRPLTKRHYQALASAMSMGDYIFNGESIVFASDGSLLDGQHRLHGCIRSGSSFDTLVVRGVSPGAFDTLDGGRTRTTGEILTLEGEANGNAVAAAISQLQAFVVSGGSLVCGGSAYGGTRVRPRMAARVLEAHPGIRDSVIAMRRCSIYRNQQSYVLHYLFSRVKKGLAADFADIMTDGSEDKGRPFNVLRESMIRCPVNTSNRRHVAAKCVKAFNAEMTGDRPKMFRMGDSEEFPVIGGLNYDWLAETFS